MVRFLVIRFVVLLGAESLCFQAWASEGEEPVDTSAAPSQSSLSLPPPVRAREASAGAPQPAFNTGIMLGICGVGEEKPWQATKFCLAGIFDVLMGREQNDSVAYGGYGQVATAGFDNIKTSTGAVVYVPHRSWLNFTFRAGGVVQANTAGLAPGVEAFLEVGQRGLSFSHHYSLAHTLFAGFEWVAPVGEERPSATTIWLGLRFDAYWLSAPAALFQ